MPSQRSRSLLLQAGSGTNWWALEVAGPRGARLDARSSLCTSGTLRASASSSPSEPESHADLGELRKSLSQRRMMLGHGDVTSCSSIMGGLGFGDVGNVISEAARNPSSHLSSRSNHVRCLYLPCKCLSVH